MMSLKLIRSVGTNKTKIKIITASIYIRIYNDE